LFDLPDLSTLRLCSMLASLAFGAMFLVLRLGRPDDRALGHWAAGAFSYALVLVGFELAHGPPSIVAGALLHSLLAGSDILILTGIRAFDGRRSFARWMLLPLLGPGLVYGGLAWLDALGVALGAEAPRTVGTLALLLVKTGIAAMILRSGPTGAPHGRRIAALALLAYVPTYAIAIGADLLGLSAFQLGAMLPMLADQLLLAVLNISLLSLLVERAAATLQEVALRDPLTGTHNRAWLDRHRADLSRPDTAVILIDIDHFKTINDTHGHAAGDHVLAEFAARTDAIIAGQGGALIRLGGDEFVAIIPDQTLAGAEKLADRLLAIPATMATGLPGFTASFGVAMLRADNPDIGDAMARADRFLYRAKERGRGQVATAGPRAL
jgi:diguanylate cyclase (GGDEF)-like protein